MLEKTAIYNKFVKDFSYKLNIKIHEDKYDKIVFFCVGTDRITGDSFRAYCWT